MAFLRTYEAWLIGKEVFKEADARKKRAQLENHYRVRFDADLARLSLDELRRFRQARTEYGEWLTNEDQNPSRAADR